jgi:hypothetical protein
MSDSTKPPMTAEARIASLEAIVGQLIDLQLELLLAARMARSDYADLLREVATFAALTDEERDRLALLHAYAIERADQLELQRQRADSLLLEETKA